MREAGQTTWGRSCVWRRLYPIGVADLAGLDLADPAAVAGFCRTHGVDLVVVGPGAPLIAGPVDALETAGIAYFGPKQGGGTA
jgi:phosphoribosylamine-glycine ligase